MVVWDAEDPLNESEASARHGIRAAAEVVVGAHRGGEIVVLFLQAPCACFIVLCSSLRCRFANGVYDDEAHV
eukprot:1558834-Pyramimonas_sp.AAC.1